MRVGHDLKRPGSLYAPLVRDYLDAETRDVIEKFDFDAQIGRLDLSTEKRGRPKQEGERTT
ncbi:MAG: hypothetical protein ABSB75_03355 [Candidatus Limnocylindrales bacterium]